MPTVKGVEANAEQVRTIMRACTEANALGFPERVLIAVVMCMTQESSCQEIDYGDRDSLGPFQQRTPWGPAATRINAGSSCRLFLLGGETGQPGWSHYYGKGAPANLDTGVQTVQVSADPYAYGQWQPEATRTVAWFFEQLKIAYYQGFEAGGERLAAERYDAWRLYGKPLTRQQKAWMKMRQLQCGAYAFKIKRNVGNDQSAWHDFNRRWRYAQLLARSKGEKVVPA